MPLSCRKCLLKDMESEHPLYMLMQEWSASVSEDCKAEPEVYLARLQACTDCAELMNGLCRQCGCYVELRAIIKNRRCPLSKQGWES